MKWIAKIAVDFDYCEYLLIPDLKGLTSSPMRKKSNILIQMSVKMYVRRCFYVLRFIYNNDQMSRYFNAASSCLYSIVEYNTHHSESTHISPNSLMLFAVNERKRDRKCINYNARTNFDQLTMMTIAEHQGN